MERVKRVAAARLARAERELLAAQAGLDGGIGAVLPGGASGVRRR